MTEKWDRRFLDVAKLISSWSKDPSTKTGCVVVNDRRRILSTGYNGFPAGVNDSEERYNDRDTKYKMVAHCDSNAVYSAASEGVSLLGCTMYLTGPPCNECMKAIIQSGIKRVVWPRENGFEKDGTPLQARWADSINFSFQMAEEAGVKMDRV